MNKYSYNGKVITASSKEEAIKVFADKGDELYKKAVEDVKSLKKCKDVKFKISNSTDCYAYGSIKLNKNYSIEYGIRLKVDDSPKPEFACQISFGDGYNEDNTEDNRSILMQREIAIPSVSAGVDYIKKCIEACRKCFEAILLAKSTIFDKKFKNGRFDDIYED